MRATRLLTGAIAVATVLAAGAAGASAQEITLRDKPSDVIQYADGGGDDDNGTVLGYGPSIATGTDLRSMHVKHGHSSVSVRLTFAELDAGGAEVQVGFRESGGALLDRLLFTTAKDSAVVVSTSNTVKCTVDLTVKTGTRGSIYARVPRWCLSNPVKLKAAAILTRITGTEEEPIYYVDFGSSTKYRTPEWTPWLARG